MVTYAWHFACVGKQRRTFVAWSADVPLWCGERLACPCPIYPQCQRSTFPFPLFFFPLFLRGVPLNESTRKPPYVGVAPRLKCTCDRKDGISDLIRMLIKRRYPTGSVVAAEHLAVSFSHIWNSSMNFPPRRSEPTAGF